MRLGQRRQPVDDSGDARRVPEVTMGQQPQLAGQDRTVTA
jgi:hypothetical protein